MHARLSCVVATLLAACGGDPESSIDAPPNGPFPDEVLRNGDFEQLDSTGWAIDWENHDDNADGEINVVTDPHLFGGHALQWQIDVNGGWEYFVIQHQISAALLVPGRLYEITGYFMVDRLADLSFVYIVRGEPGSDPDLGMHGTTPTRPTAINRWQPFQAEFTIPLDAAPASYMVYLHSMKSSRDTMPVKLTVDGVSIHPKPGV